MFNVRQNIRYGHPCPFESGPSTADSRIGNDKLPTILAAYCFHVREYAFGLREVSKINQ
jgi:hypothetical protein